MYTRFCAMLSKLSLMLAVAGLMVLIGCVQYQVVGRYVFNDTPTWAEAVALLLVLYITALGLAVGVRDAGHIGMDSIVSLLPERLRLKLEILIHLLVGVFGALMAYNGYLWAALKWDDQKPLLPIPSSMDYVPLIIAGVLVVLFTIEHVIALIQGKEVVPAWN